MSSRSRTQVARHAWASATLLLAACAIASGASGASNHLAITGYIEDGSALALVNANAPALTSVGADGVVLNDAGSQVSVPDPSQLALLRRAHGLGLRAQLLVSNFDNAINDFSPRVAANLLSSASHVHAVASSLAALAAAQGWDGITVDLESLNAHDERGLVDFVTVLRHDLPTSRTLNIDVGAANSLSGYHSIGFDLTALARVVTRVVVMAYDQHGPWSNPGPVGALAWQRQALGVILGEISPTQVDLGVAGYGYDWPAGNRLHDGTTLSDAQARQWVRRDHAHARWIARSGEWTATLSSGTVLWWSDARSYQLRRRLAEQYHLHGLALWQLATSDRLRN